MCKCLNKAGVAWPRDEKEKFLSTAKKINEQANPAENGSSQTQISLCGCAQGCRIPQSSGIIDRDLRAHETLT